MAGEIARDDNVAGARSSARFVYINDALEKMTIFNQYIFLPASDKEFKVSLFY